MPFGESTVLVVDFLDFHRQILIDVIGQLILSQTISKSQLASTARKTIRFSEPIQFKSVGGDGFQKHVFIQKSVNNSSGEASSWAFYYRLHQLFSYYYQICKAIHQL